MTIQSQAFANHEKIPKKYSCDGDNINPPLDFDDFPKDARELALIVDDPDASGDSFVHWLVYNIPLNLHVDENSVPATEGKNGKGQNGYTGPCPPSGEHHYVFKLYALDTRLDLPKGLSKSELEAAMKGHILAKADLVGLYARA